MKVCYELTMPNNNSWNGKWTGADKKYYVVRSYFGEDKKIIERIFAKESGHPSFYYNFGDGWGANVECQLVTAVEAKKRLKASKGFCGYEWMIKEIETHGYILSRAERKEYESRNKVDQYLNGIKIITM